MNDQCVCFDSHRMKQKSFQPTILHTPCDQTCHLRLEYQSKKVKLLACNFLLDFLHIHADDNKSTLQKCKCIINISMSKSMLLPQSFVAKERHEVRQTRALLEKKCQNKDPNM